MTPYLERQVYSPQATAGRGIRSTVGQRFYGGLSQNATPTPTPVPQPSPLRPMEAMYAPEPMPTVDPQLFSGDGPGEAGEGLVGPDKASPEALSALGLPSTPPKGILGHAKAGWDFLTTTMNPFILAPRLMIKGITGGLGGKDGGPPPGSAFGGYEAGGTGPGIADPGGGTIPGTSMIGSFSGKGALAAPSSSSGGWGAPPAGASPAPSPVSAPPTSGLADMGFGDGGGGGSGGLGGFGTGFGHGGFGAGATGGFGGGGEGIW